MLSVFAALYFTYHRDSSIQVSIIFFTVGAKINTFFYYLFTLHTSIKIIIYHCESLWNSLCLVINHLLTALGLIIGELSCLPNMTKSFSHSVQVITFSSITTGRIHYTWLLCRLFECLGRIDVVLSILGSVLWSIAIFLLDSFYSTFYQSLQGVLMTLFVSLP